MYAKKSCTRNSGCRVEVGSPRPGCWLVPVPLRIGNAHDERDQAKKAADHQQKLQPWGPLDAVPPQICYLMMPLKESAVPSRLAHDLRRKRVLGYGHRIRLRMTLEDVEFISLRLLVVCRYFRGGKFARDSAAGTEEAYTVWHT